MKTRREFLKTVAAGSAAAIATVATQSAAATVVKSVVNNAKHPAPKSAPAKGVATPAHVSHSERMDPAEIAKQKKYTADALKVIRNYVLPAGSPMAFSFKPLKAARGQRPR
jgi:hypothetical protein